MDENLLSALIAVGSAIVGAGLTFISQLVLNKKNEEYIITQATIERRIDSFDNAIRYILNICSIYNAWKSLESHSENLSENKNTKMEEVIEMEKENERLYSKFYYIFQMFISKEIEDEYNNIRYDAMNGRIEYKEAYEKLCSILKFKIKDIVK